MTAPTSWRDPLQALVTWRRVDRANAGTKVASAKYAKSLAKAPAVSFSQLTRVGDETVTS